LTTQRALAKVLAACRDDPDLFNRVVLRRPPYWSRQKEIARSVVRYRITVPYTGNAIGKDYAVGGIVPWWLATRPDSMVIVTGPSQTLLGSVTWKEIRRAIERSPILSRLGIEVSSGIKSSPQLVRIKDGWHALGYSTTSVERASGQHCRHLLVIVEEASGVEDSIWDALDSLKYSRLLAIGNPLRADGRFIRLIRQAEKDRADGVPPHLAVHAIHVPSTESPDADKEESKYGLADATFLADMARRYGVDSLWYRCHILAQIPAASADVLLPEAWLDWCAAQGRPELPPGHPVEKTRRIGCDLGEGVGRDSSAVLVRDDLGILEVKHGSAMGLPEAAATIAQLARSWKVPPERITYDRVGIGRDFPHHLARHGLTRCVGYAGEASPQSTDFPNLRSEAAWKLRQRLEPGFPADPRRPHSGRPPFVIPPGPHWHRLREELRTLTYTLVGRQTRLLPKKDWQAALGHSPDLADALIQTFSY
jgi:hypothetical protein